MMTDREFVARLSRHRGGAIVARYASLGRDALLRAVVRGEAEGEPEEGQSAVAHVVLNRVAEPSWWGSTVAQVALWPWQFSCFWSDHGSRRAAIDAEVRRPTAQIARAIARADDPTGGATYYWNPDVVDPGWSRRVTIVATIGRHVFAIDAPPVARVVAPEPSIDDDAGCF